MNRHIVNVAERNRYHAWPLHDASRTRVMEQLWLDALPKHTLMRRAGQSTAQLALAIAPHAQQIWIACGPGNNGGDGLEAAIQLQAWGKKVAVTWAGDPHQAPGDTRNAWQRAKQHKVQFLDNPPSAFDLGIDALLGLGCNRMPNETMLLWLKTLHARQVPVLAIDLPTGLHSDTGQWLRPEPTSSDASLCHTLSLLTLKPGLFTGAGKDASGTVWFDDLTSNRDGADIDLSSIPPSAWLQAQLPVITRTRLHSSHKGCRGDLMVVGGAPGMTGAAVLAAMAGLNFGAGRVFVGLIDEMAQYNVVAEHPTLMVRRVELLPTETGCVVCGPGGGQDVFALLPKLIATARKLVLDADALNGLATDSHLLKLFKQRAARGFESVITPHPLEAARLLGKSAQDVQANRLQAAHTLAELTQATVVLKGSGTIIAETGKTLVINPTGNARLATAGTGDVLAGMIGANLAQGVTAFEAACDAVRSHGYAADTWPASAVTLNAETLAKNVR